MDIQNTPSQTQIDFELNNLRIQEETRQAREDVANAATEISESSTEEQNERQEQQQRQEQLSRAYAGSNLGGNIDVFV